MSKHTPMPFRLPLRHRGLGDIGDAGNCTVALTYSRKAEANADLIVRAVNSYEAHRRCVEALRAVMDGWRDYNAALVPEEVKEARSALAALEDE